MPMIPANQRLSKQSKEQIINAIMADVPGAPLPFPQFLEKLQNAFKQRILDSLPAPVRQLVDDPETSHYVAFTSSYYLYWDSMGTERGFSTGQTKRISNPRQHGAGTIILPWYGDTRYFKVDPITAEEIVQYTEAVTTRAETRAKLESALAGISYRKQFIAAFPEFERYLPKEGAKPSYPVAIANVVADLSKMGWPSPSGSAPAGAALGAA